MIMENICNLILHSYSPYSPTERFIHQNPDFIFIISIIVTNTKVALNDAKFDAVGLN